MGPKTAKAYVAIRTMINTGELAPGDKLPPERKLSESLNIGRTALRQVLADLLAQGVLEVKDRSGYLVAPQKPTKDRADTLRVVLARALGKPEDTPWLDSVADVVKLRLGAERATRDARVTWAIDVVSPDGWFTCTAFTEDRDEIVKELMFRRELASPNITYRLRRREEYMREEIEEV